MSLRQASSPYGTLSQPTLYSKTLSQELKKAITITEPTSNKKSYSALKSEAHMHGHDVLEESREAHYSSQEPRSFPNG